jgi:hypothetical protein
MRHSRSELRQYRQMPQRALVMLTAIASIDRAQFFPPCAMRKLYQVYRTNNQQGKKSNKRGNVHAFLGSCIGHQKSSNSAISRPKRGVVEEVIDTNSSTPNRPSASLPCCNPSASSQSTTCKVARTIGQRSTEWQREKVLLSLHPVRQPAKRVSFTSAPSLMDGSEFNWCWHHVKKRAPASYGALPIMTVYGKVARLTLDGTKRIAAVIQPPQSPFSAKCKKQPPIRQPAKPLTDPRGFAVDA